MPARAPKVFAIGLPHSGGSQLAALFDANGYLWRHHQNGKLAQSIAFARAAGTVPLIEWPNAVGFSDLHSMHKRHLPDLRVQDFVAYLHEHFPDAYFIHTHRDPADWIAARFSAEDGEHRAAAAWHANIQENDLPEYWLREQKVHAALCADHFMGNSNFIDFNVSSEPIEKLIKFLAVGYDLDVPDVLPDVSVSADEVSAVVKHLSELPTLPASATTDISFAAQVTEFCRETPKIRGNLKALSNVAVTWPETGKINDKARKTVPLVRDDATGIFHLKPGNDSFIRAQSTLNELVAHVAKPPLHIDMMDARFIGSEGRRTSPPRTIAYNRRKGAVNLTLWPLPGYHSLAPVGHAGGFPRDEIPFADKADRCVWLGNMTGRMSAALSPEDRPQYSVYNMRDRAETLSQDNPDWPALIADLDCVPRYHVVKTYRDHRDFEVGLVLRAKWKRLAQTPAFKGLCDPKRPRTWFHQFRYILSLAGNDTGSNFLSAASSNALILKEEDGWELFYTGAFKPWIHYVPLEDGALDVEEKLGWARANPDKSVAMVTAASDMYARFANPNNRRAILNAITARMNDNLG